MSKTSFYEMFFMNYKLLAPKLQNTFHAQLNKNFILLLNV